MSAQASHPGDLLLALVYREVTEEEARRLQAHLEGCPECTARVAGYRAVRSAAQALPRELPSARGVQTLLLAAGQAAAQGRRRRATLWRASLFASAAAAAVALLWLRPERPPAQPLSVARAPAAGASAEEALAANESAPQGEVAGQPADDALGASLPAKSVRLKALPPEAKGAAKRGLAKKAEAAAPGAPPPAAPAEVASAKPASSAGAAHAPAQNALDVAPVSRAQQAQPAAARASAPTSAVGGAAPQRARDEERLLAVRLRLQEAASGAEVLPLLLEACELEARLGHLKEARADCARVAVGYPGTSEATRANAELERLSAGTGAQ